MKPKFIIAWLLLSSIGIIIYMGIENKSSKKEIKNQSVEVVKDDKNILQRIAGFFVETDNGTDALLKMLQEPQGTEEEQAAAIEELLKKGAKLKNIKNEDGETALMMAINEGNIPVTEVLLKYTANVNETDHKGNTALIHAVMPHYQKLSDTPLRYQVSFKGNPQILEMLIQAGANVNHKNKQGETALSIAQKTLKQWGSGHTVRDNTVRDIGENKNLEKIVSILESADTTKKPTVNLTNNQTEAEDKYVVVKMKDKKDDNKTVAESADIPVSNNKVATDNNLDDSKGPNLIRAIKRDEIDTVRSLINEGANVNFADESRKSVLMHAIHFGPEPEIIKLLLNAGADVNFIGYRKQTALVLAMERHNDEIIKILLNAGADVNCENVFGNSMLMEAVSLREPKPQLVKAFIAAGADVNFKNSTFKDSVLTKAIRTNGRSPEIVKMLIDAGADVNYYDTFNSILEIAENIKIDQYDYSDAVFEQKKKEKAEIIAMLKAAGAKTKAEILAKSTGNKKL